MWSWTPRKTIFQGKKGYRPGKYKYLTNRVNVRPWRIGEIGLRLEMWQREQLAQSRCWNVTTQVKGGVWCMAGSNWWVSEVCQRLAEPETAGCRFAFRRKKGARTKWRQEHFFIAANQRKSSRSKKENFTKARRRPRIFLYYKPSKLLVFGIHRKFHGSFAVHRLVTADLQWPEKKGEVGVKQDLKANWATSTNDWEVLVCIASSEKTQGLE